MRFNFSDYKGLLLVLLTSIAALWLTATNKLNLYIHPRYIIFTAVLSAIAVAIIVFGSKYANNHSDEIKPKTWLPQRLVALVICLFAALALLVSRPVPLTSATATQRGINSATSPVGTSIRQPAISPLFTNNDYSSFTIRDWTSLLAQTTDPDFFTGKNVDVTGFVVADSSDRKVFYVSRFIIGCCAVDARPIGLPVYAPDWQKQFKQDDWVKITGAFVPNPSALITDPVAIQPAKMQKVSQPENSYEY